MEKLADLGDYQDEDGWQKLAYSTVKISRVTESDD
jgi:hypothetical protein